jgi:hypothetical protein
MRIRPIHPYPPLLCSWTAHNRPLAFLQFWPSTLTAAGFDNLYAEQLPQLLPS